MAKILGVKFKNTAKTYYFAPEEGVEYQEKSGVIVETAKGLEYGTVVIPVTEVADDEIVHPLKPVIRKATEKDEKTIRENEKKIPEALEFANQKIAELNLNMKLIGCEYAFDGKKLAFFFSSDNRVDFRELVKILAAKFHVRIELRQIGIRTTVANEISSKETTPKETPVKEVVSKEEVAKARRAERVIKCVASNVGNGKNLTIETPKTTYTQLGLDYYYGKGVAFDVERAFLCFNLGAQKDEPESFYWIGTYYEKGRSFNTLYIEANRTLALAFYEKAAELGVAEAVAAVERLKKK